MRILSVLFFCLLETTTAADGNEKAGNPGSDSHPSVPEEVRAFIERRDLCDHFRGEEPYDEARARFLEKRIRQTCAGTDAELKALKRAYRDDESVQAALNSFEPAVEPKSPEPLAAWAVYTLVSEGRKTYEGDRLRAVLRYGETGAPEIILERIHVEMAHPARNGVVWSFPVDLVGARPDPCPIAESYCASVGGLRWVNGRLLYDVVTPSMTLGCTVSGITKRAPETNCTVE